MRASIFGALIGAMVGFALVLALKVFVVESTFLKAVLFPGRIFFTYADRIGTGDFGLMIFDFFAYLSNILLYAAIGFGLGRLFEVKRTN